MRQGKTRQRFKPLSQREASRDSKAAQVEADVGQGLASKTRPGDQRGRGCGAKVQR